MADLFSLLAGDDPSAQARAEALSRLMKQRQGYGTILALTGDRTLAPVGQGLAREGAEAPEQIAGLMNQRAGRLLSREQMLAQKAQQDRAYGLDERQRTEQERHNRAVEARPPSFPVIYGAGNEALRIDPRNPAAPAVAVVGPDGAPVKKAAMSGHGGMAEVAERKRTMLSDGQVKIIAEYDNGLAMLQDIGKAKAGVDTGPVAARRNALAGKFGLDDPNISSFRAMVGDQLASYIRSISGAAASDRERAFLMQNIPKVEDSDAVFEAKLKVVSERLAKLREIELGLFGAQGKEIDAFRPGAAPAAGPDAHAPETTRRRRFNPATGALE
jgi:hypothetical protein